MRALELKIPPPVVMAILAAAMYAAVRLLPHWQLSLPFAMRTMLAGMWGVAGVGMAVLGALAFRRHRTTVNPLQPQATTQLVTTGLFAHSRNPMYLGMVLCLTGWAVWLTHPLALFGVVLFIACLHWFQIKPEERILLHKFGEPYAQYLRRVRRWI